MNKRIHNSAEIKDEIFLVVEMRYIASSFITDVAILFDFDSLQVTQLLIVYLSII